MSVENRILRKPLYRFWGNQITWGFLIIESKSVLFAYRLPTKQTFENLFVSS
jgi:hypothetical protein